MSRHLVVALLCVAQAGCFRWAPIATSTLGASGTTYALRRVRVQREGPSLELTVERVEGGALRGRDAHDRPRVVPLGTSARVTMRQLDELATAAVVGAIYALIFTVSAASLIIGRE